MKKGIGAAPFAIVAALIIALAGGLWATQPAQAGVGDVLLTVTNVGDTTDFIDPGGTGHGAAFGPEGRAFEFDDAAATAGDEIHEVERSYAAADIDGNNVFRGAIGRGAATWVEFQAGISDASDAVVTENRLSLTISVEGEASLSKTSTLSSAECAPQTGVCKFGVYSNGTPGDFTVTAAGVEASLLATAGDPASKNGQFVGPAVAVEVLDGRPSAAVAADQFGAISPANFAHDASAGLRGADEDASPARPRAEVGFLFKLTDSAGQVAMNTTVTGRDDVSVSVVTDLGKTITIAGADAPPGVLSNTGTAGAQVYVDVQQEGQLGTGYPIIPEQIESVDNSDSTGGLIAVGLAGDGVEGSAKGRICVDVDANGTCEAEHAFAISGTVDGAMSSVSGIVSGGNGNVNLAEDGAHVRIVTLRDKNEIPINGLDVTSAQTQVKDTSAADGTHLLFAFAKSADAAKAAAEVREAVVDDPNTDDVDETVNLPTNPADGAVASGKDGAYPLGISASDDKVGLHSFSVTIGEGHAKAVKTADADGNPLEAHIASDVKGLAITSVTNLAGDDLLSESGGTQSVAAGTSRLLTITLSAAGSDGLAPINGRSVTAVSTSGGSIVGADAVGVVASKTNNAGEVTVRYVFGGEAASTTLVFTSGSGEAVLIVAAGDEAAAAGPATYSLASAAGATFHSWDGGEASSSVFENVANLVRVWWWSGSMWIGYTSNPNAPSATKTDFAVVDKDTLFIVATGPVSITLD